jgi:hypothetical protein
MISPDARRSSPLSGRKATYRPVQIPQAGYGQMGFAPSKSSQSAIVPQTTSSRTSGKECATRHASRGSSMIEK